MKIDVKFSETSQNFAPKWGEVQNLSDGGFERGYAVGYAEGYILGQNDPKPLGNLSKYIKFKVKPTSTTVFNIENPLGGIAKKVSVTMSPYVLTSKRRCRKYIADYDLGIAVGEYSDTGSSVLYASKKTTQEIENGCFKITEGKISLYRYNSANAWETDSEYEVEIWQ